MQVKCVLLSRECAGRRGPSHQLRDLDSVDPEQALIAESLVIDPDSVLSCTDTRLCCHASHRAFDVTRAVVSCLGALLTGWLFGCPVSWFAAVNEVVATHNYKFQNSLSSQEPQISQGVGAILLAPPEPMPVLHQAWEGWVRVWAAGWGYGHEEGQAQDMKCRWGAWLPTSANHFKTQQALLLNPNECLLKA